MQGVSLQEGAFDEQGAICGAPLATDKNLSANRQPVKASEQEGTLWKSCQNRVPLDNS